MAPKTSEETAPATDTTGADAAGSGSQKLLPTDNPELKLPLNGDAGCRP